VSGKSEASCRTEQSEVESVSAAESILSIQMSAHTFSRADFGFTIRRIAEFFYLSDGYGKHLDYHPGNLKSKE